MTTLSPRVRTGCKQVLAAALLAGLSWLAEAFQASTPCLLTHPDPPAISIAQPAMIATVGPIGTAGTCSPLVSSVPTIGLLAAGVVAVLGLNNCLQGLYSPNHRGDTT
jgi:hypothetical protein